MAALLSATGVDLASPAASSLLRSFFDFLRRLDDLGDFSKKSASWKSSELRLLSCTSSTELRLPSVDDLGKRNISFSRSGSLADFEPLGEWSAGAPLGDPLGDAGDVGEAGAEEPALSVEVEDSMTVVGTTRLDEREPRGELPGSRSSGDLGERLGSGETEFAPPVGTVRLEERDWRPASAATAGDIGSGVRLIDTPEMKSVGERGMPVSDSYSFELSVSSLGDLQIRIVNAGDLEPGKAHIYFITNHNND